MLTTRSTTGLCVVLLVSALHGSGSALDLFEWGGGGGKNIFPDMIFVILFRVYL